jgi:hypothetical protein
VSVVRAALAAFVDVEVLAAREDETLFVRGFALAV